MESRGSHHHRAPWLAGTSLGILAALAGSPQRARAACLVENTASVTCDATNQATAGTLTTTFGGATTVNVNDKGKIDTGGASATVTAAGDLVFNNNDKTFGIVNTTGIAVNLQNDFGAITYTGSGAVSSTAGAGSAVGIQAVSNAAVGGITLSVGGPVVMTAPGSFVAGAAGGILAEVQNPANASALVIHANGDIQTNFLAIQAFHAGTGAILVDGSGNISNLIVASGNGDITIGGSGGTRGIAVSSFGDGNVLINRPASGIGASTSGGGNVTVIASGGNATGAVSTEILSTVSTGKLTVNIVNGSFQNAGSKQVDASGLLVGNQGLGSSAAMLAPGAAVSGNNGILASNTNSASSADIIVAVDGSATGSGGICSGKGKGGCGNSVYSDEFLNFGLAVTGLGIGVSHSGTGNITIATGTASTVTGANAGIQALRGGKGFGGSINVTVGGAVSANGGGSSAPVGVLLLGGTANTLTNLATGSISGELGVQTIAGSVTLDNQGAITGTGGTAVQLGGSNNTFIMNGPSAKLSGIATGSGNDIFRFAGSGANSFDVGQIGTGFTQLEKTGSSIWTLTGVATTTAPWLIGQGLINFSDASNFGTSPITLDGGGLQWATGTATDISSQLAAIGAGGATFDTNGNNVSFATGLTGPGGVIKTGAGTLTFTTASSYGGATTINGGTLKGGGANVFSPSSPTSIGAGGTLDLGGFAQQINSVTLNGGTLTNGQLTGAISSAGGTMSNIGGLASLTTTAGITVVLGTNSYTGPTTINGGTLKVDGAITNSSSVTVNAGGTLTGTGTVDPPNVITIGAGAFFAPGNGTPGSSMTIAANLAFLSGAQYVLQFNPTTSTFANVTGTATLGGATVNATFAGRSHVSKRYTILTAQSVTGTFNTAVVSANLPANFKPGLSYDANHAYLDLTLAFNPPSPANLGFGLNGNQNAVGNALINFFDTTGGIPFVLGALTPAGLTHASGEIATRTQQTTFSAVKQFIDGLTDWFGGGRGQPVAPASTATPFAEPDEVLAYSASTTTRNARESKAYAAFTKTPLAKSYDPRWSVWSAGFGGAQNTSGNAIVGSNAATSQIVGGAAGADYHFAPQTIGGFALAGGGTSFGVSGLGAGRSDLFQAGAFIRHTIGPAYVTGALAYGWQDFTTDRTVVIAGVDRLRAHFNANALSGRLEGGTRFVAPWSGIGMTPYAAVQVTTLWLPAYAEAATLGSNTFALGYAAKAVTDPRSELGVRADKSFALHSAMLTLRGRAAWAHDFNPNRSIAATFQTLPGTSFVVNGAGPARNSALTTAAAELQWPNGLAVAASFEGEFSAVTSSYAGKGIARYTW